MFDPYEFDRHSADWTRSANQRLLLASFIGTMFLSILLVNVDGLRWASDVDRPSINVTIQEPPADLNDEPLELPAETQAPTLDEPIEAALEQETIPATAEAKASTAEETKPGPDSVVDPAATIDWYAEMEKHTSKNPLSTGHLSPLAAAKAAAQKKYAPVDERREIWDYVEKDPYGRTLLRSGDCFRVLDDPHLPTIDIFENFTRFLVFCQNKDHSEISLDGLDEILKRYKHLQPPQ